MKTNRFITAFCAAALAAGALTSCSDDNSIEWDDNGSKIELPAQRMFIINEGSFQMNNATLTLYNPGEGEPEIIDNVFFKQNGQRLGDTAQDMIAHNGFLFISVHGSNYLVKLNPAGVEQKRVSFAADPELQGGIRYIVGYGEYIYASFYGGVVAKINAFSLDVEKKLKLQNAGNIEGVAIANGSLYVANTYEITTDPTTGQNIYNYFKNLFEIDLASFSLKGNVIVEENPNKLISANGKLYLISNNYSRESYVLQTVNPADDNKTTEIGYATDMAAGNGTLYFVDSRTDWATYTTTNTFGSYNMTSGAVSNKSFLKDAPAELASSGIYMMTVDNTSGEIYIATSDYVTNGNIYRFKADGSFVEKFDCGGINPKKAVFFK